MSQSSQEHISHHHTVSKIFCKFNNKIKANAYLIVFFFFLFFSVIEFQIHRNTTHPEYNRFKRNVWIFFNFCSSSKCIAYLTISLRFGLDFIYLFICLLPRISSCLQLFQPLMKLINK